ncbi:MAG: phosphotransacetylase family protein [Candidatus Bathyarchaeia archaeon]
MKVLTTPSLFVCSIESFSGKSMFCLGLALTLRENGHKVGYFKPVGWEMIRDSDGRKVDEDAQLMKEVLNLKAPLEEISPIILGTRFLEETSKIDPKTCEKRVLQAYENASDGIEIMIIEGPHTFGVGASIGVECMSLTKKWDSHIVLVSTMDDDTVVDRIILNKKFIDSVHGNFLGAVMNCIPKTSIERVKGFASPILMKQGIDVLGVIPDKISLRAPTVREICKNIACTVLTCKDRMDLLVEDVLVGAMTPESALSYFRKSMRKAVITGGDRVGVQLAALQTDTSVLILTGNIYPDVRILARAEQVGVPVLLVPHDTYTTVKEIANLSGRIKPKETKKIELAKNLVKEYVDWKSILSALMKQKKA